VNKNAKIGYFAQHMVEDLPGKETPVQVLMNHVKGLSELDARQHLGTMGISGKIALQPCEQLSGGQKSRVVLARSTMARPQILIVSVVHCVCGVCACLACLACLVDANQTR
jgi:ATP-binding cassette subfamily F protein 3